MNNLHLPDAGCGLQRRAATADAMAGPCQPRSTASTI